MAITDIPGLEKGKFQRPDRPKNRLNWLVYGDTKTGKSSFALSGRWENSPVVVFDIDRRLERVADELEKYRPIRIHKVDFPKVDPMSRKADESVKKLANAAWDDFLDHYDMALKSSFLKGGVRNISIDTATELFDLRLMAEHGRLMGINPRDRGGANAEFVEVLRRPEQYDANVVWAHHVKDEWKNITDANGKEKSITTGRVIPEGYIRARAPVQIVAQTIYNDNARDPRKRFEVHIIRCGVNSSLNGKIFTSDDWMVCDGDEVLVDYGPLAYISSLIVPGTDPSDWA